MADGEEQLLDRSDNDSDGADHVVAPLERVPKRRRQQPQPRPVSILGALVVFLFYVPCGNNGLWAGQLDPHASRALYQDHDLDRVIAVGLGRWHLDSLMGISGDTLHYMLLRTLSKRKLRCKKRSSVVGFCTYTLLEQLLFFDDEECEE